MAELKTVSPEAQVVAEEVLRLLGGMTVPCDHPDRTSGKCPDCGSEADGREIYGSGFILDPRFADLLAVVSWDSRFMDYKAGVGFSVRWRDLPKGSLEGALGDWLENHVEFWDVCDWERLPNRDNDLAAVQVVKAALEAQKEG